MSFSYLGIDPADGGRSPHVPIFIARNWTEIITRPQLRLGLRAIAADVRELWGPDAEEFYEPQIAEHFAAFERAAGRVLPRWPRVYLLGGADLRFAAGYLHWLAETGGAAFLRCDPIALESPIGKPLTGSPPPFVYSFNLARLGNAGVDRPDGGLYPDCVDMFVLASPDEATLAESVKLATEPNDDARAIYAMQESEAEEGAEDT